MASVNYYYRSKKKEGSISVRFSSGQMIDAVRSIPEIKIPQNCWDKKKERAKNVGGYTEAGDLNEKLTKLRGFLQEQFNKDYTDGEEIDSEWLSDAIGAFFNRPKYERMEKEEKEIHKYVIPFAKYWYNNDLLTDKWRNKYNQPLSYKQKNHYKNCIDFLELYETERNAYYRKHKVDPKNRIFNKRLKHSDMTIDFAQDFDQWMTQDIEAKKPYFPSYAAKTIVRIRFFCRRAEEAGITVHKEHKNSKFNGSGKNDKAMDPYLSNHEIDKIYNHDFSDNERLDNARDWLIIGCYTALRISDLKKVSAEDILNSGCIHLITTKTDAPVTIPLHDRVKAILKKRNGEFPRKISDVKFNKYVKEVCQEAGLTHQIKGSLKNPKTNRMEVGIFPKYKLIASHIGRRSFATNHFGLVSNRVIMDIGGWKTEKSMMRYLKKVSVDSAKELETFWKSDDYTTTQLIKVS